jgi:hypothetical protein
MTRAPGAGCDTRKAVCQTQHRRQHAQMADIQQGQRAADRAGQQPDLQRGEDRGPMRELRLD